MKKIINILIACLFIHTAQSQNVSSFPYIEEDTASYVENQVIIWLEQGVDAESFAANSGQGIVPKRVLSKRLNIWLFEFTNVEQRSMKMRNLITNTQAKHVQNNHTNMITNVGATPACLPLQAYTNPTVFSENRK